MSRPTEGTDTSRPAAISGSMPMTTNSVVPMPKAPMARASRARGKGRTPGTRGGREPADGVVLGAGPRRWRLVSLVGCSGPPPRGMPGAAVPLLTRRSGLDQHLDGAVLLLAEVHVRLGGLLERHPVRGEVVDAQRVALEQQRE